MIKVPLCPELTVERVLKLIKGHKQLVAYLPDISEKAKQYIERDFLFTIVNTIDRKFFKEALAEIEARRAERTQEAEQGYVEIDPHLF